MEFYGGNSFHNKNKMFSVNILKEFVSISIKLDFMLFSWIFISILCLDRMSECFVSDFYWGDFLGFSVLGIKIF